MLAPNLEVTHYTISMRGLPSGLDGIRIAHISDFHVGDGAWGPAAAAHAVEAIERENPDIVVNTGDYMQWEPPVHRVVDTVAPFVRSEDASWVRPTFSILGNHDYYAGDEAVEELSFHLGQLGVTMLINRGACWTREGAELSIVGLTQEEGDLEAGIDVLLGASRPRIALLHRPDLIEHLPRGAADLVLAGHTHGGQMVIPGFKMLITRKFAHTGYGDGFYFVNGMLMFINRGLGTTGLPLRYNARPEVSILRLTR